VLRVRVFTVDARPNLEIIVSPAEVPAEVAMFGIYRITRKSGVQRGVSYASEPGSSFNITRSEVDRLVNFHIDNRYTQFTLSGVKCSDELWAAMNNIEIPPLPEGEEAEMDDDDDEDDDDDDDDRTIILRREGPPQVQRNLGGAALAGGFTRVIWK